MSEQQQEIINKWEVRTVVILAILWFFFCLYVIVSHPVQIFGVWVD